MLSHHISEQTDRQTDECRVIRTDIQKHTVIPSCLSYIDRASVWNTEYLKCFTHILLPLRAKYQTKV